MGREGELAVAVFDPGGIIIIFHSQFCARGLSRPHFVIRKGIFNHCGRSKAWNSTHHGRYVFQTSFFVRNNLHLHIHTHIHFQKKYIYIHVRVRVCVFFCCVVPCHVVFIPRVVILLFQLLK